MSTWRGALLGVITVTFAVAAFVAPAMPQPPSYHAFADHRTMLGIPNFLNVASNLPFLVAGALGLAEIRRGGGRFIDPGERVAYVVFFLGALLTAFGSSWYHAAPDNARLVWDRLPMTLGFAGLVAAAVTERVDPKLGRRSLWPLVALGVASVAWWQATEQAGAGNVVPYAVYQGWTIAVVVLLIVAFPARRYSHGSLLAWAAGLYGLAKLCEAFDHGVFAVLAGTVSGHTVKHLLAAAAVFAILGQLRLRSAPASRPEIA